MKVIHPTQLPTRLPFLSTLVLWMLLDLYKAPGWAWGVALTLIALVWFAAIYGVYKQENTKLQELK